MHVEGLHLGRPLLGLLDGLWCRIVEAVLQRCLVSLLIVVVLTRYFPSCRLRDWTGMQIVLELVARGIVGGPFREEEEVISGRLISPSLWALLASHIYSITGPQWS